MRRRNNAPSILWWHLQTPVTRTALDALKPWQVAIFTHRDFGPRTSVRVVLNNGVYNVSSVLRTTDGDYWRWRGNYKTGSDAWDALLEIFKDCNDAYYVFAEVEE